MKKYDILLPENTEVTIRPKIGQLQELKVETNKITVVDTIDTGRDIRCSILVNNKIVMKILFMRNDYKSLNEFTIEEINNKIIDTL